MNMREVKDLKDTAEMMTSEDYKERFKAEYAQACIRYQKLAAMLEFTERIFYNNGYIWQQISNKSC